MCTFVSSVSCFGCFTQTMPFGRCTRDRLTDARFAFVNRTSTLLYELWIFVLSLVDVEHAPQNSHHHRRTAARRGALADNDKCYAVVWHRHHHLHLSIVWRARGTSANSVCSTSFGCRERGKMVYLAARASSELQFVATVSGWWTCFSALEQPSSAWTGETCVAIARCA